MAAKKQDKFKIADPAIQIETIIRHQSKYKIGEKGYNFYNIKHLKPIFAFDFLSFNGSDLCFNSSSLNTKDYIGLLEGLKKLSAITYNDLKNIPAYRFHSIDFDKDNITINKRNFKQALVSKEELLSDDELPTLYQVDIQYVQAARICGFLYKGVFYLVWYDRNHLIYGGK